jgi:hypothetical protein
VLAKLGIQMPANLITPARPFSPKEVGLKRNLPYLRNAKEIDMLSISGGYNLSGNFPEEMTKGINAIIPKNNRTKKSLS